MKKVKLLLIALISIPSFSYACGGCVDGEVANIYSQNSILQYQKGEEKIFLKIQEINNILNNKIIETEKINKQILENNLNLSKEDYINNAEQLFVIEKQNQIQNLINTIETF